MLLKLTKYFFICFVAGAVWSVSMGAHAGSTRRITFINNTAQDANDLHIEFRQAVNPQSNGGLFGPFGNANGTGTSDVDFSGGTVNAGAQTQISFTSGSSRIRIDRWWWTRDGVRIGRIMRERDIAMVTFDQDRVRPGEMATVEIYAAGQSDAASRYLIQSELLLPDGTVGGLPLRYVDVSSGQEHNERFFQFPPQDVGEHRLDFHVTNLDTGETVAEGSSSLTVDDGTRELLGILDPSP